MKFRLIEQHYDMKPGTIWYDAGPCVPQPGQGPSHAVTEKEGDQTEGALRVVPLNKMEVV